MLLPWEIFASHFKKGSRNWMFLILGIKTHIFLTGEVSLNVMSTCLLNIPLYLSPAPWNVGCQNPAALMTSWSAGFALPPLKRGCRARTACIHVRTTSSQGHGALRGEQSCGGAVRAPGGIYCCVQQTPPFCLLCLAENVLWEMFHVQFLPWPLSSASKSGKKYF